MHIHFYEKDLPAHHNLGPLVAIDTEAMGLHMHRDRLCLVQLSNGDGHCHLVQIIPGQERPQNLIMLLENPEITKIFHFARFDVAALYNAFNVVTAPIYCTKIASKLTRTFTDKHGLKELCKEFLKVEISKQEQTSDWGAKTLTEEQKKYAASDVLHLHKLKHCLDAMLEREDRVTLAKSAFDYLPTRAILDVLAGDTYDILAY